MTTLRLWLLRALTALLAFAFAMPACTVFLWRDNRTVAHDDLSKPPELRAFRLPKRPAAFVLQLPPPAAKALRVHVPELPENLEWLLLRPRADDAAARLDEACKPDARWPLRIEVFREAADTAVVWAFDPGFPNVVPFGGVDHQAPLLTAACDVEVMAKPPDELGEPILAVALEYATMNDDGTSVPVRIALTPLALALDAVVATCAVVVVALMIPLVPIVWLVRVIGGDK